MNPCTIPDRRVSDQDLGADEAEWKTHFKGKELSKKEVIEAIARFPKLMERPVVVRGNKAVVGRPPENVHALIGN